jgi:hypothetical protein
METQTDRKAERQQRDLLSFLTYEHFQNKEGDIKWWENPEKCRVVIRKLI